MAKIENRFGRGPLDISVAKAIEHSLIEDDGGIAECAYSSAQKCAAALGFVLERMHTMGIVSDAEMNALLNYKYKIAGTDA